jgi:hypothetical protein
MPIRSFAHLGAVVLVISAIAACGPAPLTSALDEPAARSLVEHALVGLDAGDYAAWSRDWSPSMKAAIGEDVFLAYRSQLMDDVGRYRGLEGLELVRGRNRDYVRWNAIAAFEGGRVRFGFGFHTGGTAVEGVFPERLP